MFGTRNRADMAETLTAGANAVGETSRAIASIVVLSALALVVAVAALAYAMYSARS